MSAPTDQQILDQLKETYILAIQGKHIGSNGRALTQQDLSTLQEQISIYEERIALAGNSSGGLVSLVQFNDPSNIGTQDSNNGPTGNR